LMLVKRYGCNALPEKPLKWFRSFPSAAEPQPKRLGRMRS
jgi:hypothetical protein